MFAFLSFGERIEVRVYFQYSMTLWISVASLRTSGITLAYCLLPCFFRQLFVKTALPSHGVLENLDDE